MNRLGRHFASVALVAAAVGVGAAATIDSVRHDHSRPAAAQTTTIAVDVGGLVVPQKGELVAALRRAHVGGVLYFVDARCTLHALRLPALAVAPAPTGGGCRALISPASAPPGWSLWPRNTPLAARCQRNRLIVSASAGPPLPMIGGCTPAWRPDGSMTYVRRGAIVAFPRTGRAQVLRTSDELAHLLDRRTRPGARVSIRAIAWLAPTRLGLVASVGQRTILGVISGTNLAVAHGAIPRATNELRASPRGTFLAIRGRDGVRVYRAERGTFTQIAVRPRATAVAWSPDERWTALVRGNSVVLERRAKRIVLPIDARDVAWTRALG